MGYSQKTNDPVICRCNGIRKGTIEQAITRGCRSLPKIFDATRAGVGPCGGTCRRVLAVMLETFLQTGKFPDDPRPRRKKRR